MRNLFLFRTIRPCCSQEVAPGIRVVTKDNFNLLRAPIFDSCFNSMANQFMTKMNILFDRLTNLNSHTAYFLLKNCFAIPRFNYFLRTSPAWKCKEFLKSVDNKIKSTLELILNVSLNDKQWIQANLPIKCGGLGIRRVEDISLPAFLSSTFGVNVLVSHILKKSDENIDYLMEEALQNWISSNNSVPNINNQQKQWDSINIKRIINENLTFDSNLDIARFKALQRKESGAWLNSIPSTNIGTFMDNNSFRICIGLRLGSKICQKHTCICGTVVQENGIHGLSFQKSAGRNPRHIELNNIVHRSFMSVNVPPKLEPSGLSRDDGKLPNGLTLIPWEKGQSLVWDATCIDTLADSYLSKSISKEGFAVELAQNKKHSKCTYIKSLN